MNPKVHELMAVLESGPLAARDLATRLGVSQPTVSRLLSAAGDRVLRLGKGPAMRYALPRVFPTMGHRFPIWRVTEVGEIAPFGELEVYHGGYQLSLATETVHQCDDLPWFIQDMRPQGYLGRLNVQLYQTIPFVRLNAHGRISEWAGDQILAYLVDFGGDGPGDLLVGDFMRHVFGSAQQSAFQTANFFRNRNTDFPWKVSRILAGENVQRSSAAGEQPKFIMRRLEDRQECIVKFSPPTDTPAGLRWADLLHCEHLALEVLSEMGASAAKSSVHSIDGRAYLEVPRFDRVGEHGRRGIASLEAVNGEFGGVAHGDGWSGAGIKLAREKVIAVADAVRMGQLEAFGHYIANTDMHFGNLSFFRAPDLALSLAPIYDMLPMYYAPVNGEVVDRPVPVVRRSRCLHQYMDWAQAAAREFWWRVSGEDAISQTFRDIALQHLEKVA